MLRMNRVFASTKKLGGEMLEYVIIAVGVAIFCTFGILMFGKAAQGQMKAATDVLAGQNTAQDTSIHDDATNSAQSGDTDSTNRTGTSMDRE